MPSNLTVGNVHINRLLTDYAIGYRPDEFVAEQVWAPVPVKKQSDDFAVWTQADAFRINRVDGYGYMVADGAEAMEENASLSFDSYKARPHKLKTRVTDQQLENADPPIGLKQTKVNQVQDKLLIAQELRVAAKVTNTANYASTNRTTNAGATQWNDGSFVSQPANQQSAIVAQILGAKEAIRIATGGKRPNRILIPNPVWNIMANDPGLNDRVKYTNGSLLTNPVPVEELLGMKIVVPGGLYTSALEGSASATLSDIWGKNVVLYYYNPAPGTYGLTFGSIFRSRDWLVRSWRDEPTESELIEAGHIQDEKGVAYGCAYLIKNVIA